MQYDIFDEFSDGMLATSIPLSWYRAVTQFIKGISGGGVVRVRNENGVPTILLEVTSGVKDGMKGAMNPYRDSAGVVQDSEFDGDSGADTTSWVINEDNKKNGSPTNLNGCVITIPTRFEHPTIGDPRHPETLEKDKSVIRLFFRSSTKAPSGIDAAITPEIGYKDVATARPAAATTSEDISGHSADDYEEQLYTIPSYLDPQGKDEIWKAGEVDAQGKPKGYIEDAIVVVEEDDGSHLLWHVIKEYSADGRLLRVRKFSDGGGMTWVGA